MGCHCQLSFVLEHDPSLLLRYSHRHHATASITTPAWFLSVSLLFCFAGLCRFWAQALPWNYCLCLSLSLYMIRQFISFVSQPLWFSPRLQYTVHPTEYYPFLPRGTKSLDGPGDPLPINLEPVDGGPPRYPRCITRQGRGVVSISSELAMA